MDLQELKRLWFNHRDALSPDEQTLLAEIDRLEAMVQRKRLIIEHYEAMSPQSASSALRS